MFRGFYVAFIFSLPLGAGMNDLRCYYCNGMKECAEKEYKTTTCPFGTQCFTILYSHPGKTSIMKYGCYSDRDCPKDSSCKSCSGDLCNNKRFLVCYSGSSDLNLDPCLSSNKEACVRYFSLGSGEATYGCATKDECKGNNSDYACYSCNENLCNSKVPFPSTLTTAKTPDLKEGSKPNIGALNVTPNIFFLIFIVLCSLSFSKML